MNPRLVKLKRILILDLPLQQSAFLWGGRKTGKSTFLQDHYPGSVYYDLLKNDLFIELSTRPEKLREEVLHLTKKQLKQPIIIDEVQRVPALLNEIHWLIENTEASFILCGSSARQMRKKSVNLLGGRAWRFHFFPLVYPEIPEFDLLRALNHGLLPSHYLSNRPKKFLESFVLDYLTHEIQAEGATRNLPAFTRFMESLRFCDGEMISYANISRECGVDAKTIKAYFEILIETMLGYFVLPYRKKIKRSIISSTPKFYLFDVGLAGYIAKRQLKDLKGSEAGHAFENYILMELMAARSILESNFDIHYWRTKSGLEVDFILGDADLALEVKIRDHIDNSHLKGLLAFGQEHPKSKLMVVCNEKRARIKNVGNQQIEILPYKTFLKKLWKSEII